MNKTSCQSCNRYSTTVTNWQACFFGETIPWSYRDENSKFWSVDPYRIPEVLRQTYMYLEMLSGGTWTKMIVQMFDHDFVFDKQSCVNIYKGILVFSDATVVFIIFCNFVLTIRWKMQSYRVESIKKNYNYF